MSPSASASPDATLPPGAGQGLLRPSPWSPPSHMPMPQYPCEATMVLLQGGAPVGQWDAFSGLSRILIRRSEMPSSAVGPHGRCWPLPILLQPADRACSEDTSHGSWHRSLPKRHGAERTGRLARSGNFLLDPRQATVPPTYSTSAVLPFSSSLTETFQNPAPRPESLLTKAVVCLPCTMHAAGLGDTYYTIATALWLGAISRICPL